MKKIINYLKKLKKQNIVAVKQSLEDEGASFEELTLMRKITKKASLKPKRIKICGLRWFHSLKPTSQINLNPLLR